MTLSRITSAVVLAAIGFVTGAQAMEPISKTREQVRAEFEEARRNGDILAPGDSGLTLREQYPDRYPKQGPSSSLTRAEVRAELQEARRTGDVPVGDTGLTQYDIAPQNFPPRDVAGAKTRAQVRAEFAEALRNGDVIASNETGKTLRELYPLRYKAPTATATAASGASTQSIAAK